MPEPVLFWNHLALEANRMDHTGQMKATHQRGPTLTARALAMLHIAVHDACVLYYPTTPPSTRLGCQVSNCPETRPTPATK